MATDPSKLHDLSGNSIPGNENSIQPDPESGNALDNAFKAAGGDPTKPSEPLADLSEPKVKEKPAPPEVTEKPAAPVKTEDDEEKLVPKELPNASDVLDEAERKAREPKEKPVVKDETPPESKKEPAPVAERDELDSIDLPVNAKPKTVDSFDKVKAVARERIAAVTKEREALAKEVETLKGKVVEGLPKEVEAELKALREFRAKIDVEADPAWTSYDKTVAENTESIYAKLLATPGIDQKSIDKIKELGGPQEVDWDGPNIKLPAQVRRFLDAKLVENESILEKKTKAIADAKNNAEQYLSTRREEQTKGAQLQNKAVETEIEAMLPKFSWFRDLKAKEGATDAEKAAIDEHNKLIEDSRNTFKLAAEDNSPGTRAILAVGYAQLLKTRVDFGAFRNEAAAKEATAKAEKDALTKELEEVKAKLEKVKRSSTTRLRDTPAEDVNHTNKPKQVDINTPGGEALDRQLAAIRAKQED